MVIDTCCTLVCSAAGVDNMCWSDWTAWDCRWNLSLVRSCIKHTET